MLQQYKMSKKKEINVVIQEEPVFSGRKSTITLKTECANKIARVQIKVMTTASALVDSVRCFSDQQMA